MLRVAFLGGSIRSAVGRAHFSALNLDGNFKILGGCFSRDSLINRESADFYGVSTKKNYSTRDELIADSKNFDLVVVLTPTPNHADDLIALRTANCFIVSEKSLTNSLEKSLKIGATYTDSNLSVIFNYTGYPMIREIKKRIENGQIGSVRQVCIEMPQEGFGRRDQFGNRMKPQDWRLVDFEIPTLLLDLGVHLDSLIYFLTKEIPQSVYSTSGNYGNFEGIIDSQSAILKYESGMVTNFWITKTAIGERNGLKIRIYGSEGSFSWVQERPDEFISSDKFGQKYFIDRGDPSLLIASDFRYTRFKAGHPTGFIESLANYYLDIHNKVTNPNIVENNDYVFGWKEAHQGLVVMDAINQSALTHQEIFI
jgi:predicted dehydrogenase